MHIYAMYKVCSANENIELWKVQTTEFDLGSLMCSLEDVFNSELLKTGVCKVVT